MPMSRKDHLAWCKERAMNKHEETALDPMLSMMGMLEIANGPEAVRRWVDGFN